MTATVDRTDPDAHDWKPHRVRAGSHDWEGDAAPTDPNVHRKHIEPWLAALLQAEHVNLLVGRGLTTGITTLAGAPDIAIGLIKREEALGPSFQKERH